MALTLKQFVDNVSQSGLLGAKEVSACYDSLADDKRDDVQELAKLLVREKKLTKYQAQIIYQGKQRGLKFGEYTVLDKLGEGGMGVVLRARHGRMEREVAIKVLPPKALKSETAVDRFYKEVRAAAKLIHPNIVTAFDASEHAGTHYLVLEFVDGKDLSEVLKEHGPLPVAQAVECTIQAARGLEYAHSKGLIHRDIKPANLLLAKDGTVKILDLGLARLEQEQASRDGLTKSGQIMGTVDYMSPEQARDTKHADARSDIYSLGCTLYRLLTGIPVYDGDSIMNKMMSHAQDPIPSLKAARVDATEKLDAAFRKMVAKQADDRQQTMTEVIVDLEVALSPDAPPERRVGEQSSDNALTEFFSKLDSDKRVAPVATKLQQATEANVVEETIDLNQQDEPTGEQLQKLAQPKPPAEPKAAVRAKKKIKKHNSQPALIWLLGGGGVLCVVTLLGLVALFVGGGDDGGETNNDATSAGAPGQAEEVESAFGFNTPADLQAGRWYSLLPVIEPRHAVVGSWVKDGDGLASSPSTSNATIAVPAEIEGSYELFLAFTRNSGDHSVNCNFPVGDRLCSMYLDVGDTDDSLLGPTENPTVNPSGSLTLGQRYTVYVTVQRTGDQATIDVELNGRQHLHWSGASASLPASHSVGQFSIGSFDGDTVFHQVAVHMTSGKGRVTEASPVAIKILDEPVGTAQRIAAEWIIGLGGSIIVTGEGHKTMSADDLPDAPFTIEAVYLGKTLGDKHLHRLWALENLHQLGVSMVGPNFDWEPLQRFRGLQWLSVEYTAFGDEDMPYLNKLMNLRTLQLRQTRVTANGLTHLPTKITHLNLRSTKTDNDALSVIRSLAELTYLNLDSTQVNDEGMSQLANLSNLEELDLNRTSISKRGLMQLQELMKLKLLDVSGTGVTSEDAAEFQTALPNCEVKLASIDLFNGQDLTGLEPIGDANLWSVKGGILTATGAGTGWLSTKQEFDDFALDLEYRLPSAGNSGVFLRVPRGGPLNGGEFVEVQLWDDAVDPGNGNYTASVFNISKVEPSNAALPAGEWNAMEIRVQGSRITVTLNGERIQDVDLGTATIPPPMATNATRSSGHIGLQCHRTAVEFQNLRLRPL
jgi:serine/threonine protein kinase